MADFMDSIDPKTQNSTTSQAQGQAVGNVWGQWQQRLQDPAFRAGLIQSGLAMLQPVAPGQSPLGHIASGVGQGFEAHDRNIALEEKRGENLRKEQRDEKRLDIASKRAARSGGVSFNTLFRARQREQELAQKKADAYRVGFGKFVERMVDKDINLIGQDRLAAIEKYMRDPRVKRAYDLQFGKGGDSSAVPDVPPDNAPEDNVTEDTNTEAGVTAAPAPAPAPKMATADFIKKHPAAWERVRGMLRSNDPREREAGAAYARQIQGGVSDPDSVTSILSR